MQVRLWGTRGSIATPGPTTLRYGGNTSCVEVRSARGTLVVLDCGTGARALGRALVRAAGDGPLDGSILLGHTHWDHIQGLPFFEPLFRPGRWDVYGPRGLGTSLAQVLGGQMQYQYFPVTLDQLGADVEYHELVEGTFTIGDLVVRTQYLNHPALTLGFRIEGDGVAVCYLADHEPHDRSLGAGGDVLASRADRRHVEFMAGADVVLHDAQYLAEEYPARIGWGHSTVEYVVDAACAAGVGRTVLIHHDPSRTDDDVDALLARAVDRAAGRTVVEAGAEGGELRVAPAGRRFSSVDAALRSAAASPAVDDLAATVVVLSTDEELRANVAAAAAAEALALGDGVDGVDGAGRTLLVVDLDSEGGALDALHRALAPATWSRLAVLAVTRTGGALASAPAGVVDWLVWPATTAHVRTKLRAAVLRRACRWLAAPLPPDEPDRLRSLHALGVLDTGTEERFDRLTRRARELFDVPIALVTLVDGDRQWFKSRAGIDAVESPRDESVCAHAILGPDVLHVPDLLTDDRFADNPAVSGPMRARFYAGAPLELVDGSRVGTLCVVDHRPRVLDAAQLEQLRSLAREVVDELCRPGSVEDPAPVA